MDKISQHERTEIMLEIKHQYLMSHVTFMP